MLVLDEKTIISNYDMKDAIEAVRTTLKALKAGNIQSPHRTVINIPKIQGSELYMPCANLEKSMATIKVVSIFPHNPIEGKATTQGIMLLTDTTDGTHLAVMNASYLTRLRTGALSGLATYYLAREDAKTLAVIGTGGMAFEQVLGVLAVREITKIYLYNRTIEKAAIFKDKLKKFGITIEIEITENVDAATIHADIINCATRSATPVFNADYLKEGVHINGVGSYLPEMREIAKEAILQASQIIVDDLDGVKVEAGEFIEAERKGIWSFNQVKGEIADLIVGEITGRNNKQELTIFKSVGAAYYDLAVAIGVYEKAIELDIGTKVEL
ncbi:ornithine cyclodeaminase family protein [Rummeliibacillus pycnus]|uniref:ornithine cyclodeaminase family protein n=1 Tax=Rummeliibacillus pycnus TaxID=101070 RepID=UPI003D2A5D60